MGGGNGQGQGQVQGQGQGQGQGQQQGAPRQESYALAQSQQAQVAAYVPSVTLTRGQLLRKEVVTRTSGVKLGSTTQLWAGTYPDTHLIWH